MQRLYLTTWFFAILALLQKFVCDSMIYKDIKLKIFMKRKYKGGVKIYILLFIITILIIGSAMMFGYGGDAVQSAKEDTQNKAQDALNQKGEEVMGKVIGGSQEIIGQKLKETGEKMLEEEYTAVKGDPGFYGDYGEVDATHFERVILFFTAPWCPSCTDAQNNIEINQKEIPANVAVVRVDFDHNNELREKYNVNKQHTFVLIDKSGEEISRWDNSKTLSEIIDNIK